MNTPVPEDKTGTVKEMYVVIEKGHKPTLIWRAEAKPSLSNAQSKRALEAMAMEEQTRGEWYVMYEAHKVEQTADVTEAKKVQEALGLPSNAWLKVLPQKEGDKVKLLTQAVEENRHKIWQNALSYVSLCQVPNNQTTCWQLIKCSVSAGNKNQTMVGVAPEGDPERKVQERLDSMED